MPCKADFQLDFTEFEALIFQDATTSASGAGASIPTIVNDPADANKSLMACIMTDTTGTPLSQWTLLLDQDYDELWFEVEGKYDFPAAAVSGILKFLLCQTLAGAENLRLQQNGNAGGPDTRATVGGSSFTFGAGTDQPKVTIWWIKCHYKKDSGIGDGLFEAWVDKNDGNGFVSAGAPITTHIGGKIGKFIIESEPSGAVLTNAGNKAFWAKRMACATVDPGAANHIWVEEGLSHGLPCSDTDPTKIDVRMFYRCPRALLGRGITNWQGVLNYKKSSDSVYTSLPAVAAFTDAADVTGDTKLEPRVNGLDENTSYDFTLTVSGTGLTTYTTPKITLQTPSAAAGTPTVDRTAFTSCTRSVGTNINPKVFPTFLLAKNPHRVIHGGDLDYGSDFLDDVNNERIARDMKRCNLFRDPAMKKLPRQAGYAAAVSDHDKLADNAACADPNNNPTLVSTYIMAQRVWDFYISGRVLKRLAAGCGWWMDTARQRIITTDGRTFRNPVSTPAKFFGDVQLADIIAKVKNTGKPINVLIIPEPSSRGLGQGGGSPDGPHLKNDWLAEVALIFAAFHAYNPPGSILLLFTGDAHWLAVTGHWLTQYGGRVKPEFQVSPGRHAQRQPRAFTLNGGSTVLYNETDLTALANNVVSRYAILEVDEVALTAKVDLYDGVNDFKMYSATYQASLSEGGTGVPQPQALYMFKSEAKTFVVPVLDADGVGVSVTGRTMRFVVETAEDPGTGKFDVESSGIAAGGDNGTSANVSVTSTQSNITAGRYEWRLWDINTNQLLAHGPLYMLDAVKDVA